VIAENATQGGLCQIASLSGIDLCSLNAVIQSFLLTVVLIIATISLLGLFWKYILPLLRDKKWEAVEVEILLGNIGKVTIRPNHEIMRIAHQGYVEFITRKAGLKFDEDNDVIVEVYNSWYEMFKEFRILTKSIPAENIRDYEDARLTMDVFIRSLNLGLRPHLTKYQAKFRRWYKNEEAKYPDKTPQEIQKMYPDYQNLISDLKNVNTQMLSFGSALQIIAYGTKR